LRSSDGIANKTGPEENSVPPFKFMLEFFGPNADGIKKTSEVYKNYSIQKSCIHWLWDCDVNIRHILGPSRQECRSAEVPKCQGLVLVADNFTQKRKRSFIQIKKETLAKFETQSGLKFKKKKELADVFA
jgi:hypothetical protein